MISKKKLSAIVDEVLSLSTLPPNITSKLRTVLINYYDSIILLVSDDYPTVAQRLYEINDNEMYAIISLCSVDEYSFFLVQVNKIKAGSVFKKFVEQIKKDYNFSNNEIGTVISKIIQLKIGLNELLDNSIRTKRKSTGYSLLKVVLPPMITMKKFYECERKTSYSNKEEALQNVSNKNEIYLCHYCSKYHQGKAPTGQNIPKEIIEGRYQTTWRRYHHV